MLVPTHTRQGDPFALMQSMLREIDLPTLRRAAQPVFPAVNVWQGDEAIAVTTELPGVDPTDIDISFQENVLTISGERKAPELPEEARWHRQERGFGKFTRSIRLPFAASDDNVEARMTNGVLRVVVGRPEEDRPIKIEIKPA